LVRKFEQDLIELLLAPDQVLIYGEFYPNNILYRGGAVTPIDWESAALALGSIDLVCLVEGWPPDLAAQCVEVYCIERWGGNRPQSFGAEFLAATAYVHFRWLGDRPEWTNHPDIRWRFDSLREIGASLGIK
jgi:aminoglycoside/choline kinase family phosphotransferase